MGIVKATIDNIMVASQIVQRGGVIVYPTDTVYGLGCDPFNTRSVSQLLKTKGERKKPLPVLASDMASIKKIAHVPQKVTDHAPNFWPGPLTLILPKKETLPDVVTSNLGSVGVRIPHHAVAMKLIQESGGLLIGTSANKTGEKPARTAQEARVQLGHNVDLILDGGETPLGTPSTIIDLASGPPKLLREGPISLVDLQGVFP
jgi:L-threonylcarbamoyladenylate synthase